MTIAVGDIVFHCPQCHEAIIAACARSGQAMECPHGRAAQTIPDDAPVNKEIFREPPGLRRAFDEMRDRDRLTLRRKLGEAVTHSLEIQSQLRRSEAEVARLSGKPVRPQVISDEVQTLKKQLAELNNRILVANQAFSAGRQQHDTALERLRRDLEAARTELQLLQREKEELAQNLRVTTAELDRQRQLAATVPQRSRNGRKIQRSKAKRQARSRRP